MFIGWKSLQATVRHPFSNREMVKTLPSAVLNTEQIVHGIIEVTTDTRTLNACRFRFEIEHMAQHAGLPEQPAIVPGACFDDPIEISQHTQAEYTTRSYLLMTGDSLCRLSGITFE